jgi:hypothetical protein
MWRPLQKLDLTNSADTLLTEIFQATVILISKQILPQIEPGPAGGSNLRGLLRWCS